MSHEPACYSMLFCMRTTLDLDDALMRRTKALAAREGVTLTALMERALHDLVDGDETEDFVLQLPVVDGHQVPQVDVTDREALFEAME